MSATHFGTRPTIEELRSAFNRGDYTSKDFIRAENSTEWLDPSSILSSAFRRTHYQSTSEWQSNEKTMQEEEKQRRIAAAHREREAERAAKQQKEEKQRQTEELRRAREVEERQARERASRHQAPSGKGTTRYLVKGFEKYVGPLSIEELRSAFNRGDYTKKDLIRVENSTTWLDPSTIIK